MAPTTNYFLLFISTWVISQTLKYLISTYKRRKITFKHLAQTYLYASGAPSTHTAILTSCLLALITDLGWNHPVTFTFAAFAIIWIFEIYLQRRRFKVLAELLHISQEKQSDLLLLKDLNGRDATDLIAGFFVGLLVFTIFRLSF